jgi:hypothetical protein
MPEMFTSLLMCHECLEWGITWRNNQENNRVVWGERVLIQFFPLVGGIVQVELLMSNFPPSPPIKGGCENHRQNAAQLFQSPKGEDNEMLG